MVMMSHKAHSCDSSAPRYIAYARSRQACEYLAACLIGLPMQELIYPSNQRRQHPLQTMELCVVQHPAADSKTSVGDLPPEILQHICSLLHDPDDVANCHLVDTRCARPRC